jgi:aryl-alcohol dehydrogenase-like predicted oxidoreductase
MFPGHATASATERYARRFNDYFAKGFFRSAQGLTVSSLGIGTYLGRMDERTDAAYTQAVGSALNAGINFIDTSLNYRHQRSERAIARALSAWIQDRGGAREEAVLCTKAGYLVPDALPSAAIHPEEIAGGIHCLAPAFLSDQIRRSRRNLGVETIDIFYLHNPETQLAYVDAATFDARIRAAFQLLEHRVETGEIRYYGTATWDGFRRGSESRALSLVRLNEIAKQIAGELHHFRFIQLPVNLAMTEALSKPLERGRTVLEWASEYGLTVVSSASLLQARLTHGLPDEIAEAAPGAATDAQRALQFARSVPGVTVALAGMSSLEHVRENLGLGGIPPLAPDAFLRAFA